MTLDELGLIEPEVHRPRRWVDGCSFHVKGIIDLAVSGEHEELPVEASSRWREMVAEPDLPTRLGMLARLHGEICVREAPPFTIVAEAAGSDPEIRGLMQEMADQRYEDHYRLAKTLHQTGQMRTGLSARRAADIIWTLANERTYLALVGDRRWSNQDYEQWLADQLIAALLDSGGGVGVPLSQVRQRGLAQ